MNEPRRQLSKSFLRDFGDGKTLHPIIEFVKKKRNRIDFQIRDGYVNLYYRGGNLLRIIEGKTGGYKFEWTENYIKKEEKDKFKSSIQVSSNVSSFKEAEDWVKVLPKIEKKMDEWFRDIRQTKEKFIQQAILQNGLKNYIIIDTEYQKGNKSRFDLVALKDIGNSEAMLSLIELKHGYSSLSSENKSSGLYKHYVDIINEIETREDLRVELMQAKKLCQQKNELGLMDSIPFNISNDSFEILFLLADYKTKKSNRYSMILEREIEKINKHVEKNRPEQRSKSHSMSIKVNLKFLDINGWEKDIQFRESEGNIHLNNYAEGLAKFYGVNYS